MSCEWQPRQSAIIGAEADLDRLASKISGSNRSSARDTIPSSEQRRQILKRTFEQDIIPHLLRRSFASEPRQNLSVERLASLCVQADAKAVVAAVLSTYDLATDFDRVFLDVVAPTARLLGAWWADDLCTFTAVTVGVGHLRAAMHILAAPALADEKLQIGARRPCTILMPLPGEQHSFGVSMLATFFNRAGWDTKTDIVSDSGELRRVIGMEWADMVGFSVSHVDMLEAARDAITVVRAASGNPKLVVMVGGLPFTEEPSLAEAVGADATATDGAQAVITASTLLCLRN